MTSSTQKRGRMRPAPACFRPRTWPISWARTAPTRCRNSSVARSGCFNCSLSLLSATQGMETRTVADLLSGANAVRPHVWRAADIRITVTLVAVSLPLTHGTRPVARLPVHQHSGCLEERVGNLGRIGRDPPGRLVQSCRSTPGRGRQRQAVQNQRPSQPSTRSGPATPGPGRGSEQWDASASSTSVLIANVRSDAPWSRRAAAGSVHRSVRNRWSEQVQRRDASRRDRARSRGRR